MTIRPKASEMSMGHLVEFTILCLNYLYACVWEHLRLDPFGPFVMGYGLVGPFKLGQERIL